MMEVLVYIGLVMVILGTAYAAAYRCIDNSTVLRRNAEDIAKALNVGELWRSDVRAANGDIDLADRIDPRTLRIPTAGQDRFYRFDDHTVLRRLGEGSWVRLLTGVKSCQFIGEQRDSMHAVRWELELQPRTKGPIKAGHVRPLFTFIAAVTPPTQASR